MICALRMRHVCKANSVYTTEPYQHITVLRGCLIIIAYSPKKVKRNERKNFFAKKDRKRIVIFRKVCYTIIDSLQHIVPLYGTV